MMRPVTRRERWLVGLWLALGVVLWNAVYDMMLGEGIKEYLFRSALHEAGRGPHMTIAAVLDPFVFDATWVATFWSCLFMAAGFATIRLLAPRA